MPGQLAEAKEPNVGHSLVSRSRKEPTTVRGHAAMFRFDVHMHTGDLKEPFDIKASVAQLQTVFAEQELDGGLVFCMDNDLTKQVLKEIPNAQVLYWAHPVPGETGWLREAEAFLNLDPRVRGVKFHPLLDCYRPSSPMLDPMLREIEDRGLVAFFHTGHAPTSTPTQLFPLADRFPRAQIVLGHMGGQTVFYVRDAIDMALRFPHIWLDTSAMPMSTLVREAQEQTHRVMYGADWPCHAWQAQRAVVEYSGLGEEDLLDVLGRNAARLLGLYQ